MKRKEFLTFVISLFLAVTLPVGVFLLRRVQTVEKRAEGGPASLQLTASKENLNVGDSVDFTIRLDPGGEQIYGANILITFDSSVFEIIDDSVTTDTADFEFANAVVNEVRSGEVEFSPYIQPGSTEYMETEGSIGMFSLRVRESASEGSTTFIFADSCTVNEITNYEDVLGSAPSLVVNIGEGGDAELASVSIQPTSAVLEIGQSQEFAAVAYDSNGNRMALDSNNFRWGSSPTEVGSLSSCDYPPSDGSSCRKFTAEAEGTAVVQVTASQGGISEDAEATVSVPSLAALDRVEISPPNANVQVQQKQVFCADGYSKDNERISLGADDCQWSVNGGIGTIEESLVTCCAEFTGTTVGGGSVVVSATKNGGTAEGLAEVNVTEESQPLSCSVGISELTATAQEEIELSVSVGGGTGDYSYQWEARDSDGNSAGSFDFPDSSNVVWTAPSAGEVSDGEKIIISVTVSDGEETCRKEITVTMDIPVPTLSFDFQLENKIFNAEERIIDVTLFAREQGSSVGYGEAPWGESIEVVVNESSRGSFASMALEGLRAGGSYEFLLKGPKHLQTKKAVTDLRAVNNLDFGVLLAGDVGSANAGPPDNRVDSFDIGLWTRDWSPWEPIESPADINGNGYVDSFDYTYIHKNFGKEGDR